ncbi:ParB/RepB/Spo0J family partition protein [Streptococcus sp. 20-1249]|uniref:ParB/RepB/Spo0J family partition protein n=1 Tax=Streptococcus hepaticus TaxID=3349163 RepID=UPI0037486350
MEAFEYLSISDITPNPYQPRLHFDDEKLAELARSIKENGLIQPIIVRKSAIFGYELLAGERRWRASQLAGLEKIPAVVKELSDQDMLYQSIIENLQRADLNPIEEAKSYQKLLQKGLTHDEIAQIMGKSRPYITNIIRLLNLSQPLIQAVEEGQITQGHARLLVPLDEENQVNWLQKIKTNDISVRKLEQLLAEKKQDKMFKQQNIFIQEEEEKLRKKLGTSVKIKQQKNGQGSLTISFATSEEFERIIQSLK